MPNRLLELQWPACSEDTPCITTVAARGERRGLREAGGRCKGGLCEAGGCRESGLCEACGSCESWPRVRCSWGKSLNNRRCVGGRGVSRRRVRRLRIGHWCGNRRLREGFDDRR